MSNLKLNRTFMGAGVISAFAASLCCISPIIAVLAGSTSLASNFSWIEPARPILIGSSILALGFAWFIKLKEKKATDVDCQCTTNTKKRFFESKTFLGIVTLFSIVMMTFPLYAQFFNSSTKPDFNVASTASQSKQVKFNVTGMTCAGCEVLVNNELSKVNGVIKFTTSYLSKSSIVIYDPLKVDDKSIANAINKTGYTAKLMLPGDSLSKANVSSEYLH